MGSLSTKARSLFANAYLKVHSLLGERNFAVHGSLSLQSAYGSLALRAWCIDGTANIPTVLFSPQWVFAQNPVEQQWTELPYKLRGNKISSWGRSSPVGAPKEKPPYDQSTPKNQVASENLRVFGKRTVLRSRRRSRRDHRALRYTASMLTGNPTACWSASFLELFSFR